MIKWQQQQQQQPRKRRVEILPGSLLQTTSDPWLYPAEPSQAPPRPTEMIPFLLVGPRHSGKRTVFQKFSNAPRRNTNNRGAADHQSVVEYCKKDVTIWVNDTNMAACARVQLWNLVVTNSIPQEEEEEGRRRQHQEWRKLISKMTHILLVVSLEEGPQATLHQISKWKRWLDDESTVVLLPPVHLILTKSDLLPTSCVSPTFWINFGSQLQILCQRLGIRHFHMTTTSSCHTNEHYEAPEEVILKLVRSTVTSRNTKRQGNLVSTPTTTTTTTTKSKLKGNGSRV
jgi:hypothetical protein